MAEGYLNLFAQEDYAGTNRPHFKGFFKIDGVYHEFALWPNREGKKGFSGKFKPKQVYEQQALSEPNAAEAVIAEAIKVFTPKQEPLEDEIPF